MSQQTNYEMEHVEYWSIFVIWFATKYRHYRLKINPQPSGENYRHTRKHFKVGLTNDSMGCLFDLSYAETSFHHIAPFKIFVI